MRNPDRQTIFHFKQFSVENRLSAMKVGTDGVLLGAWCGADIDPSRPLKILDAGCGTGLIALMLAQRFPNAHVTGIEIDAEAASEAALNFSQSPWPERLTAAHADFNLLDINGPEVGEGFDLIVSNPPYFTESLRSPEESRSVARHQDSLPLGSLIARSARMLRPCGELALIAPAEYENQIEFEARLAGLSLKSVARVRTVPRKPPRRVMISLTPEPTPRPLPQELLIQNADGSPGALYSTLVSPFYLKF